MTPPRALLVDTAGPVVGVASFLGARCVAHRSLRIVNGADGWLSPAIAALLGTLEGLDRVAVSHGPGAFTGLRVGVASALGLAVARGVPVVGVCSLALRAAAVPGHARVLALLDARKGRVYAGWFDTRGDVPLPLDGPSDIPPERLTELEGALAVGEGARVYADLLAAHGAVVAPDADASPVAFGGPLVLQGAPVAPERLDLHYLRPPDAVPPGGGPG